MSATRSEVGLFVGFLLFLVLVSLALGATLAQSPMATRFGVSNYNGQISFYSQPFYERAILENNVWFFKGLSFAGSGGDFSISAKNSNITITHYNPLSQDSNLNNILYTGYVRYTVQGVGEQTFNMHFIWGIPLYWKIYIDGVQRAEGDGWTSSDGWVTVTGATAKVAAICEVTLPETQPTLDSSGQFIYQLPEFDSTIRFENTVNFAIPNPPTPDPNGTFRLVPTNHPTGVLFKTKDTNLSSLSQTDWWYFTNVKVEYEGSVGLLPLAVSAKNSNVTITAVYSTQDAPVKQGEETTIRHDNWLNYSVVGVGEQSTGLFPRLDLTSNITICIDGLPRQVGDGWHTSDEGWLTVTAAASNVSIHQWFTFPVFRGGTFLVEPNNIEPNNTLSWLAGAASVACAAYLFIVGLFVVRERRSAKPKLE
jgi:hypothetical protein